jgi:hypothetical protein
MKQRKSNHLLAPVIILLIGGGLVAAVWLTGWLPPVHWLTTVTETAEELAAPTAFLPLPPSLKPAAAAATLISPAVSIPAPDAKTPAAEQLAQLAAVDVPIHNPVDLVARLTGNYGLPLTIPARVVPLQVGDEESFWVNNSDTHETFQVQAILRQITPHSYFWTQVGVPYDALAYAAMANTFENQIYPRTRAFFGSEWTPGVDNDPRLHILFASGLGNGLAGYSSSTDEYPPAVNALSNARELFVLNADALIPSSPSTLAVLAHEFQHMIHWYQDINEETWFNEGLSELSALVNGYPQTIFAQSYTRQPDTQLTDWEEEGGNSAHYGAGFLFFTYLLDRFGESFTQALPGIQANGLAAVDDELAAEKRVNPADGSLYTADEVFADWAAAAYINDPAVADGRFAYRSLPDLRGTQPTASVTSCSNYQVSSQVSQYGVDIYEFACGGKAALQFTGAPEVRILPVEPVSGEYAFWSFRGDESDMTLTRQIDLSQASGDVQLKYKAWFDLEEDFDYVYLEASRDGRVWQILRTPGGTALNKTGSNYGIGYNGRSAGWLAETVDLSEYSGGTVWLRFEYVTDAAINGEGFLVDDIQIPAIGYFEDFETGDGGWQGAGFTRIRNRLPQKFLVTLVEFGTETRVTPITVGPDGRAVIPLDFAVTPRVAVIISGATRFITTPADYQLVIH